MKVHELLTDVSKWTQNIAARNKKHRYVNPKSLKAVCWCLMGAISRCYGAEASAIRVLVKQILGNTIIEAWNDNPTRQFSDVRELALRLDI